jgi:hypothetical protein
MRASENRVLRGIYKYISTLYTGTISSSFLLWKSAISDHNLCPSYLVYIWRESHREIERYKDRTWEMSTHCGTRRQSTVLLHINLYSKPSQRDIK